MILCKGSPATPRQPARRTDLAPLCSDRNVAVIASTGLDRLGYDISRVGDETHSWPEAAPSDGILVAAGGPQVPLLAAWQAVREQIAVPDRRLIRLAKGDPTCRLLMSGPGVGVIVATSFAASIEAPEYFRRSRSVGAYLGLTPARHQSGETDRSGSISRRGDRLIALSARTLRAAAWSTGHARH